MEFCDVCLELIQWMIETDIPGDHYPHRGSGYFPREDALEQTELYCQLCSIVSDDLWYSKYWIQPLVWECIPVKNELTCEEGFQSGYQLLIGGNDNDHDREVVDLYLWADKGKEPEAPCESTSTLTRRYR
jgi:hypothetical protein